MNYNRTMTATTYVIDMERKRVLLHLHKKFDQLYPLGGHIEPHELPHEAALREVFEESGLRVELADEKGNRIGSESGFILPSPIFLLHENTNKPVQNLDFVYIAFLPKNIDPENDMKPLSGESRSFFWADEAEIAFGKIVRNEKEFDIPGHIKSIAELVMKKLREWT